MDDLENENQSEGGGLNKPHKNALYLKFIEYSSLPDGEKADYLAIEKDPKTGHYKSKPTQKLFAAKFGLSEDTLSLWKKREGFAVAVDMKRKEWGLNLIPNVLASLYRRCVKYGMAYDVETFLSYYTGWSRTQKVDMGNTKFTMDDVRALIAPLPKADQEKYYAILTDIVTGTESRRISTEVSTNHNAEPVGDTK